MQLSRPDPGHFSLPLAIGIGLLLAFGVLARGGWDLWAQTALHSGTILLLLLFLLFLLKKAVEKPLILPISPLWLPLLCLIGVLWWSFGHSLTPAVSRRELFNWLNGIAVFLIGWFLTPQDRQVIKWIFLGTTAVVIALACVQWLQNPRVAPTGAFATSPMFGGFLVLMIPLMADLGVAAETHLPSPSARVGQLAALTVTMLAAMALAATRSVSSWIGLLGGCLLLLPKRTSTTHAWSLENGKTWSILEKAWPLLLLMVIGGCLVRKIFQPSVWDRLVWWQAAGAMWKTHPLIGAGLGSTELLLFQFQMPGLFSKDPHSLPLQLAAEAGGLGVVVLSWLVYRFFKHCPSHSTRLAAGGLLLMNCLDYSFLLPGIHLMFWFLLGETTAGGRPLVWKPNWAIPLSRKTLLITGILLSSMISVVTVLKPFLANRHLATGDYLSSRGHLDEAEKALNAAITQDALDPLPYSSLAAHYVRRFQRETSPSWVDEAILAQQQALRRQSAHAPAWEFLAQLHQLRGEPAAARQALLGAIRLAPEREKYSRLLTALH